jgi:pimeloyl-ACP methyl ester carboxylesterase
MIMRRHTISGRGIALQVLDTGGEGFPVVFLHGVMGRGIHWQGTMTALAPRYRGIALDQRGHGQSDQPVGPYDRNAYVDDLAYVVDVLGLERFAIVGHSTGALNAWVYAARYPERVAAVVLEDMNAARKGGDFLEGWREWLAAWPLPFASHGDLSRYFAAMRTTLAGYFAETFTETADGWRPRFSIEAVLATLAGNEEKDWWDELAAVRCPAMVVHGERSEWVSHDEAQRMAATLPRGQLVVVDDASHTVHIDQPAVYRELVADFLDEVIAGTPPPKRTYSDARLVMAASP